MEIKRLFDLLDRYKEKFNKPILFGGKIDGI